MDGLAPGLLHGHRIGSDVLRRELTEEQERAVVADRKLLLVAICCLNRWTAAQIVADYTFTEISAPTVENLNAVNSIPLTVSAFAAGFCPGSPGCPLYVAMNSSTMSRATGSGCCSGGDFIR